MNGSAFSALIEVTKYSPILTHTNPLCGNINNIIAKGPMHEDTCYNAALDWSDRANTFDSFALPALENDHGIHRS